MSVKGMEGTSELSEEHQEALKLFTFIQDNVYFNKNHRKPAIDEDDIPVCYCQPKPKDSDESTRCCDDVSCLNFATYVECVRGHCPAGDACNNQRIQKKEFSRLEIFKTEKKGYGLRSLENIKKNQIITEYVGEIIDEEEMERRIRMGKKNEELFYYMMLEADAYIDARNKGGFGRFFNHSCEPNCRTEKWSVLGTTRAVVIALFDIEAGTELTFDYQWRSLGRRNMKCFCGSSKCRGNLSIVDEDSDDTIMGMFREPTPAECGSTIVDRTIRFRVQQEGSTFVVATVKSFDADSGKYHVEYDHRTEENEKDALDTSIQLTGRLWHIYVDFVGKSEEEIKKHMFAIPKRQRPDSPSVSSTTSSLDQALITPTPSESSFSRDRSSWLSKKPSGVLSLVRSRSKKPTLESTKYLIKGLPKDCSKPALLSILNHALETTFSSAVVQDVNIVYFPEGHAWALVHFTDSSSGASIKRMLDGRPWHGSCMRFFPAFEAELDTFKRMLMKFPPSMHQSMEMPSFHANTNTNTSRSNSNSSNSSSSNKITTPLAASVAKIYDDENYHDTNYSTIVKASQAVDDEKIPRLQYGLGGRNNWLLSLEEMEDSPSRRAGLSKKLEQQMHQRIPQIMFKASKDLNWDSTDTFYATALVFRYLATSAADLSTVEVVCATSLQIVNKIKTKRVSLKDLLMASYKARFHDSTTLKTKSDEYLYWERKVLSMEQSFLEAISYDFLVEDPFTMLHKIVGEFQRRKQLYEGSSHAKLKGDGGDLIPKPVLQETKQILRENLSNFVLWMSYPVEYITLGALYIAHIVYDILTTKDVNQIEVPSWLPSFTQEFPQQLRVLQLSIETLMENYKTRKCSLLSSHSPERPAVELVQRFCIRWVSYSSATGEEYEHPFYATVGLLPCQKDVPKPQDIQASSNIRLDIQCICNVKKCGRRSFFAQVNEDLHSQLAGKYIYLQPWATKRLTRTHENSTAIPGAALRELASVAKAQSVAPWGILKCHGILFPPRPDQPFFDEEDESANESLDRSKYYLVYDRPDHSLEGMLQKKVSISEPFLRQMIKDLLRAMVVCHENGLLHRNLIPSSVYLRNGRVQLGGFTYARQVNLQANPLVKYQLHEKEYIENTTGSLLHATAPEVLLGGSFTPASDVWSMGCLIATLYLKRGLFLGKDVSTQLEYIFRVCGSPKKEIWPKGLLLPKYVKPPREYRVRLRKTILELSSSTLSEDIVELLESMLQLNPVKRLAGRQILALSYFASRDPTEVKAAEAMQDEDAWLGAPSMMGEATTKHRKNSNVAEDNEVEEVEEENQDRDDKVDRDEGSSSSTWLHALENQDAWTDRKGLLDVKVLMAMQGIAPTTKVGVVNAMATDSPRSEGIHKRRRKIDWGSGLTKSTDTARQG